MSIFHRVLLLCFDDYFIPDRLMKLIRTPLSSTIMFSASIVVVAPPRRAMLTEAPTFMLQLVCRLECTLGPGPETKFWGLTPELSFRLSGS